MKKKILITVLVLLQIVLIADYFLEPSLRTTAAMLTPAGPFTEDDKLSSQDVTALCLDTVNTLWVGTSEGLNLSCGNSFIQLFHSEDDSTTIPDNNIRCIHRDRKGTMWVGTRSGIAQYLGGYRFRTFRLPTDITSISQITDTEDSAILVNNTKSVYKIKDGRVTLFYTFDEQHICNYIFCDRQGGYWITNPNAITHFNRQHQRIYTRREPHPLNLSYYDIHKDTLWLSQGQNISAISLLTGKVIFRNRELLPILPSVLLGQDDGTVLVNSAYHGLYSLDIKTEKLQKLEGLESVLHHKDVTISTLYEDNNHNTVIGFQNGGFQILPNRRIRNNDTFQQLTTQTRGHSVGRLQSVGDALLLATEDGMISYRDDNNSLHQYFYYDTFNDSPVFRQTVNDIIPYGKDEAWLVTNVRIFSCRVVNGQVSLLSRAFGNDNVGPLLGTGVRQGDNILVASGSPYLIRCAFGSSRPDSIPVNDHAFDNNTKMASLPDGNILLVMKGLKTAIYHPASGKISKSASVAKELSPDVIPSCIKTDPHGSVWIGTTHDGLFLWDQTRQQIRSVDELPVKDIVAISTTPSGDLVIASQTHLMAYNPRSKSLHFYTTIDEYTDRQQQAIIHDLGIAGNNLVYSSSNGCGLVSLPSHSTPKPHLSIASIRVMTSDGRWYVMDGLRDKKRLTFPHDCRSIILSVNDDTESNGVRFLYQYRISQLGMQWLSTDMPDNFRLSDLQSGHYEFQVRAVSSPDQPPMNEATLTLTIKPSFWVSAAAIYFYLFCALLIIAYINMLYLRSKAGQLKLNELQREHERDKRNNEMNMSFFTNISHEFRNPLTIIAGPLSVLRTDGQLPEKERRMINMVCKSVNRMLKLIDQMLDFNQLEADVLKLRVAEYDIADEMTSLVEECRESAKLRGITIRTEGLDGNIYGWIDKDKFEKIMSNILTNALKHCPDNGLIELKLQEADTAQSPELAKHLGKDVDKFIDVKVSNNGKTIPEEKIEDVFKRYYQVKDDKTVRKYGWGSGIGLYYVKRIIQLHHGFIHAYNRADASGVTFEFLLPIDKDVYQEAERTAKDKAPMLIPVGQSSVSDERMDKNQEEVNKAGGKPKMLIVDDDIPVAQYIRSLFAKDYYVVNKYSAETALSFMETFQPDIILTDIVMGDMSGLELCRRIKQDVMLSHIPVILITAKSNIDEQIKGLNLGAIAYVTKPFDPRYLQALVESQLRNVQQMRQLLSSATTHEQVSSYLSDQDRKFLNDLYAQMEKHLSEQDLNVSIICHDFLISRSKFNYKLKELTGETPSNFFRKFKLNKAAEMLREGKHNVSEVAFLTGFGTVSYFSVAFKKQFGVNPSEYK